MGNTALRLVGRVSTVRLLLRRSKADGQEGSIDVQRAGCRRFAEGLQHASPPVTWDSVVEYVDDGIAGDDFAGRAALHRLMREVQAGDLVICRDHSRLGRDALDVAVVIRELVRDKAARLYYYAHGREVLFKSAIDAAMAVIEGTGSQAELEAIRSRTKESLRERVRAGYIAGGRCYGYRLERQTDGSGRSRTVAVVDEQQAEVIRWIFSMCLQGRGLKATVADLNRRGVPSPSAGRRGTGSWDPSSVREILRRQRYAGVYVHGLKDRIKQGGKRVVRPGDPSQVLRIPMPSWRIVDDATWEAVQNDLPKRGAQTRAIGPHAKHPLAGLAKCAFCGGSIGARSSRSSTGRIWGYGCSFHARRGATVCPVTIIQPVEEVEHALVNYMRAVVLTDERAERIVANVVTELEHEEADAVDTAPLEAELDRLRAEQKRYAVAIAQAPDVDELVAELRRRSERIRAVEALLSAGRRLPLQRRELLTRVKQMARAKIRDLRGALESDREGLGEVFQALFQPGALRFEPTEVAGRKVWKITGTARVRPFTLESDPTGN